MNKWRNGQQHFRITSDFKRFAQNQSCLDMRNETYICSLNHTTSASAAPERTLTFGCLPCKGPLLGRFPRKRGEKEGGGRKRGRKEREGREGEGGGERGGEIDSVLAHYDFGLS